jgi:DNA-binding NarL/FixJ family response regulator
VEALLSVAVPVAGAKDAEDDESVFAAMRAGARCYLLKGAEQEEIIMRAIRRASRMSSKKCANGA